MNPMGKFQRSWSLFTSSLSVIARNKLLLIFPVVIFSLTVVIVLFFLAPAVLRPTGFSYTQPEHWRAVRDSLFTQPEGAAGRTIPRSPSRPRRSSTSRFCILFDVFCHVFQRRVLQRNPGGAVRPTVSIGRD